MPRILRIINRLNLGGPTYNAAYLTKYMSSEYETLLLAGMKDESEASSEFIMKNLDIKPVYISSMKRSINPFKDIVSFQKIKEIIKSYKPDIVHTHAAKAGALGRLAAHQCKVPVIVHTFHGHVFHSYFHPVKTRTFIEIERYLARISSRIIAISNLQKEEIGREFKICPLDKITVIPLGFDLNRFQVNVVEKRKKFRQTYHLDDDEIAIGIIGRLVPVKNHQLFLQSVKQVLDKTTKKVRAFIIGDGSEKEKILQTAAQLGIEHSTRKEAKASLTFTSWIKEIDEATAGLDIIALTSFNEGTPVSLIEAQAANKAIVSTAVGGINDVVIPNVTAFLAPSNDVEAFSNHLTELVEDDALRIKMAKKGYRHVQEKFSYIRLVKDTELLYNELLS